MSFFWWNVRDVRGIRLGCPPHSWMRVEAAAAAAEEEEEEEGAVRGGITATNRNTADRVREGERYRRAVWMGKKGGGGRGKTVEKLWRTGFVFQERSSQKAHR
jgi:hypothetical protein